MQTFTNDVDRVCPTARSLYDAKPDGRPGQGMEAGGEVTAYAQSYEAGRSAGEVVRAEGLDTERAHRIGKAPKGLLTYLFNDRWHKVSDEEFDAIAISGKGTWQEYAEVATEWPCVQIPVGPLMDGRCGATIPGESPVDVVVINGKRYPQPSARQVLFIVRRRELSVWNLAKVTGCNVLVVRQVLVQNNVPANGIHANTWEQVSYATEMWERWNGYRNGKKVLQGSEEVVS
jgi:hypothetical protein